MGDTDKMREASKDQFTPEERERKTLMDYLKYAQEELRTEKDQHQRKLHKEYIASIKKQLGRTGGRKSRKLRKA
jgi:hypothetical protein